MGTRTVTDKIQTNVKRRVRTPDNPNGMKNLGSLDGRPICGDNPLYALANKIIDEERLALPATSVGRRTFIVPAQKLGEFSARSLRTALFKHLKDREKYNNIEIVLSHGGGLVVSLSSKATRYG